MMVGQLEEQMEEKLKGLVSSLAVSVASYIATTLLFLRFFQAKDWAEFWQILTIPAVSVVLSCGLIPIIISALLFRLRMNPFYLTSIAVFILGVVALSLHPFIPLEIRQSAGYDIVNFGVGAIGISVAILALGIAVKSGEIAEESDKRMKAMANLEFYEKMAVIDAYTSDIGKEPEAYANRIYHDIRGALELKEYVEPAIKDKLDEKIKAMKDIVDKMPEGHPYRELLLDRLKRLLEEGSEASSVRESGNQGRHEMETTEKKGAATTEVRRLWSEWLQSDMDYCGRYHNHKETIAWLVTAFYLPAVIGLVYVVGILENGLPWQIGLTVLLLVMAMAVFAFVRMQFRMRWRAFLDVEGLVKGIARVRDFSILLPEAQLKFDKGERWPKLVQQAIKTAEAENPRGCKTYGPFVKWLMWDWWRKNTPKSFKTPEPLKTEFASYLAIALLSLFSIIMIWL